jgi:arylsulfatase A-like enzyme
MLSRGREPGEDLYIDFLRSKGLYEKFMQGRGKPTALDEDREYMDGFFTQTALDWLEGYQDAKPFFLWVNYSCPHGPYDVPQKYLDLYKPEDMPSFVPRQPNGLPEELASEKKGKKRTREQLLSSRCGHAASITYIDRQVGRIIDGLKKKGLLEKTALVFFSDQGFQLGDHGLYGKGTLFRESMNPSLIVSCPSLFKKDETVSRPVELTDLLKMCLDLAGAKEDEKSRPHGYSMLPLLTGKGAYARPGPAFGEIEGMVAAVTEQFKYISHETRPVLFDLQADPEEQQNVIGKHLDVAADLKARVDQWLQRTGPVLKAGALREGRKE